MAADAEESAESEVHIWPLLVEYVLFVLQNGETLHRRDIISRAIASAALTEAARKETLNSGGLRSEQQGHFYHHQYLHAARE